jgi:hypothetical protein
MATSLAADPAAAAMLAALELALIRLEINDCEGEEAEHIETIGNAISLATVGE